MELEEQTSSSSDSSRWEGYVDWRNRPAFRGRHGGMVAASFVLVVEALENLSHASIAANLVLYLSGYMHFSPSKAANNTTDFLATAFLLALLGGFLSDAFLTTYHICLISAVTEFLGFILLTVQARSPSLQPPPCTPGNPNSPCQEVSGGKAVMLYVGMYMVALGIGGIKGSLPTHGAEQFDDNTPQGRKQRSTFFNFYVFSLACGGLIAVTLVVWIEDNKGWQWGLGIAAISIFLSIPVFLAGSSLYRNKIPRGSPLTTILKVLVAAALNKFMTKRPSNAITSNVTVNPASPSPFSTTASPSPFITTDTKQSHEPQTPIQLQPSSTETPTQSLKFLNSAVLNKRIHCTVQQVEDVKIILKILPIFASTIFVNCCLAQLSGFSVQQAATMDTKLGSLKVPPASLPIFPLIFIFIIAPLYDQFIIPLLRKLTKSEMGISHLQRIGVGLVFSIIAMPIAALVEIKRKRVASQHAMLDSTEPLPITFFWVALQFLFLGSADLFTLAGLLEFFFSEAPTSMRSLATSLGYASMAMGYYLSSVIVSVVNDVSGNVSGHKWLSGSNLNRYHLERFYWLMAVLGVLNFLLYLFLACRYKYRSTGTNK